MKPIVGKCDCCVHEYAPALTSPCSICILDEDSPQYIDGFIAKSSCETCDNRTECFYVQRDQKPVNKYTVSGYRFGPGKKKNIDIVHDVGSDNIPERIQAMEADGCNFFIIHTEKKGVLTTVILEQDNENEDKDSKNEGAQG